MANTRGGVKRTQRPLSFVDMATAVWFLIDGITHLFLEGSYLYFAWHGGARLFDGVMAWIWKEYSRADKRWEVQDGNVMSIEALTVLAVGPLCLLMVYGIVNRCAWRHLLQVCICVAELYGGCMTFFPEWFTGSPNLVTDSWKYKWFYLAFMNGVWVIIPAVLLAESATRIINACDKAKTEHFDEGGISAFWHGLCVATFVVYSVSLPAVVVFTQ